MKGTIGNYQPVIVIPAYKRAHSLKRILRTVNKALYPDQGKLLILSLESGATDNVKRVANNFEFKSGKVNVIEHSARLGLRDHIMNCGDYSLQYGSVIVLEEDLVVSPNFYDYAQKALNQYGEQDLVAGISLYSQRFNETAQLPFEPLQSEFSAYFMQLGCSWGQAWTKNQWINFKNWYSKVDSKIFDEIDALPENIKKWDNSSWKKYFNAYLVDKHKVVVYPYQSYTTHTADEEGEHINQSGFLFQVPFKESITKEQKYRFPPANHHHIIYDAFMEISQTYVKKIMRWKKGSIAVDMYGTKPKNILKRKEYIITSKKCKKPLRAFPLSFKPLEMNLKFETENEESSFFYLYKSNQLLNTNNVQDPDYYKLAKYFSYFNFQTKKFAVGYLKEIFRFYWRRFLSI